jgi:protein with PEP-CTERM/exosortase system signal
MWVRFPPGTVWVILRVIESGLSMSLERPPPSFAPGTIICQKIRQNIVGYSYKCLLFFTTRCLLFFTSCYPSGRCKIFETGMLGALFKNMKSSFTLLLVLTAATAFFVVQPAKASHVVQGGPTYETVPDGGSTMSLLGFALLGVAALRRKLGR